MNIYRWLITIKPSVIIVMFSNLQTAYDLQEKIFSYTLDHKHIEALDDDKLYLLHSRAMYAYDALILFATVLNRALKELFNTTETEEEKEKVCEKIELPSGPALSNILTDKMVEILDKSVYCGYSVRPWFSF